MSSIKKALSGALVALVLLSTPALATILFGGGEDVDFIFIGQVGVDTNAARFRSAYAREGVSVSGPGFGSDPVISRAYTPTFTATTSLWFHAVFWSTNTSGTSSGYQVLCAITADGVCRLLVRGTGTPGTVKISTRTAGGAFVDLVTCTVGGFPNNSSPGKVDWFINYAVSGQSLFYFNGVQICSYSGDVTTGGATQVNQYYFAGAENASGNIWSEVIASTTDTRDMNLFTCAPQANGTTQTWTGTASNVNPTTINDTSAINTASTGNIANFTCPTLGAGTYTVSAVIQSARVQGAGTITNFRFNSRPAGSGADFDTTADIPAGGTFTNYPNNVIPNNPATSAPWTTSALGAGVNFGVKSRP